MHFWCQWSLEICTGPVISNVTNVIHDVVSQTKTTDRLMTLSACAVSMQQKAHAERPVSIPQRVCIQLCTPVKTITICRGFHQGCRQFRDYDWLMVTMMIQLSLTTVAQRGEFVSFINPNASTSFIINSTTEEQISLWIM